MGASIRKPSLSRILLAVAFLALFAGVFHSLAAASDLAARDASRSLAEREAASKRAVRMEPFNRRFAVTAKIVEAQALLGTGDIDGAYFLLLPLSTEVSGDDLFRETYQEALARKRPLDERKAHQQHAKEKNGGRLDAEDVFK